MTPNQTLLWQGINPSYQVINTVWQHFEIVIVVDFNDNKDAIKKVDSEE